MDHRLPDGGHLRLVAEGRHDGVGHRDRADVAGVDLVPHDDLGRPGHMGTGTRVGPGPGVQTVAREVVISWW